MPFFLSFSLPAEGGGVVRGLPPVALVVRCSSPPHTIFLSQLIGEVGVGFGGGGGGRPSARYSDFAFAGVMEGPLCSGMAGPLGESMMVVRRC